MKIKDGFLLRSVAGMHVVVAVGTAVLDFDGMISLNDTGAFMWKKLEQGCSAQELADALVQEYAVDNATALADAAVFLEKLRDAGLAE